MPFNGNLKTLLMRIVETIVMGMLIAGATVYAQSIRQDVINQTLKDGLCKVEKSVDKLNDALLNHILEQKRGK